MIGTSLFWHISRLEHKSETSEPTTPAATQEIIATTSPAKVAAPTPPPNLEEYFNKDFNFLSIDRVLSNKIVSSSFEANIDVKLKIFRDFSSNTEFISIFVPIVGDARLSKSVEGVIEGIKGQLQEFREEAKLIGVASKFPGSSVSRSEDLIFSGRVFVYTMNVLDAVQIGHLVESYRKENMFLEIRGSDYIYYKIH